MALRRQFNLLTADEAFLMEFGLPWETIVDGSQWVLVHNFPTHDGYTHSSTSIAIRLETGYPQAQLDMVYVYPALERKDNQLIPQTQVTQPLDGKGWQRWSRHRTGDNPWHPGEDSLETHIYLIEDWFVREFEKCPSSIPV
jgi:Prokaryotic E2 family E